MSTRGQCFSPPRSTNRHLPRAPAAPGEDAPRRAAEGFWLPPSCLMLAKSFPYQRRAAASQPSPPLSGGERCPWAAPSQSLGLSEVTQRRNIPCITQLSLLDEVTRASGLCTAGERCQRCRN